MLCSPVIPGTATDDVVAEPVVVLLLLAGPPRLPHTAFAGMGCWQFSPMCQWAPVQFDANGTSVELLPLQPCGDCGVSLPPQAGA